MYPMVSSSLCGKVTEESKWTIQGKGQRRCVEIAVRLRSVLDAMVIMKLQLFLQLTSGQLNSPSLSVVPCVCNWFPFQIS